MYLDLHFVFIPRLDLQCLQFLFLLPNSSPEMESFIGFQVIFSCSIFQDCVLQFQKISMICPPHGRSKIPRGRGVSKGPIFNKVHCKTLKWNFQRGGGFNSKNLPWEGYGYFLEPHNVRRYTATCKLHADNTGSKTPFYHI